MTANQHERLFMVGQELARVRFVKNAAYDWSKALKEILMNFYVLILIKLRDVCDVGNIRDVLRASKLLASDGPISVDSLYDYIINNQDKVLLILDGYDEYSCAKEHSPILAIWKGEHELRDCHVIVTTRQLKCDELIGPSHVQLEIQGFKSWNQKRTFVRKYLAGEQDLDEFMSYLKEKDLVDMAEIPLLQLMLCILWKEKHHVGLPKSRADIFTQFIQTMLDHKGGSHQSMPFQKVTSTEARKDLSNLGKVAFDALLQDRLYVQTTEKFEKNLKFPSRRPGVLFFFPKVSGTRNYTVDVDLDELDLAEERQELGKDSHDVGSSRKGSKCTSHRASLESFQWREINSVQKR